MIAWLDVALRKSGGFRTRAVFRFLLPFLVMAGACGPTIVDDFGPPAGFARVEGRVLGEDGDAKVDWEVLLASCGPPIGGFAGEDRTEADGSFAIRASLPPVGALPPGYSLPDEVTCTVVVERGIARTDVSVRFYESREGVVSVETDIMVPDR